MTGSLLAGLGADSAAAAQTRRDDLARRAAADGVLDVAYRTLDSPLGPLLVAATPAGVVRVAFETEDSDGVVDELARRVGPRVVRAAAPLGPAARQLEEYFAGRRHAFEVPLDLRLATGFRRGVLDRLRDIAYGATATYAQIATAAGSPRAVRAVGTACALNPVPLFVPCHRVVRSDGSAGRYRGGEAAKATLLALEHARPRVGTSRAAAEPDDATHPPRAEHASRPSARPADATGDADHGADRDAAVRPPGTAW